MSFSDIKCFPQGQDSRSKRKWGNFRKFHEKKLTRSQMPTGTIDKKSEKDQET